MDRTSVQGPAPALLDNALDTRIHLMMDTWGLGDNISGSIFVSISLALIDLVPSLKPPKAPDAPMCLAPRLPAPPIPRAAGGPAAPAAGAPLPAVEVQLTANGIAAAAGISFVSKSFLASISSSAPHARS